MTNAQLIKLNRKQLIKVQEQAIMTQDTETLRKIARIMTHFTPQAMSYDEPSNSGFTYLKDEVEDLDQPGYHTQIRAKHDDFLTRSFWG